MTVSGTTVTWGEHMTLAQQNGAMSVLFGGTSGVRSDRDCGRFDDLGAH